eukprot:s24_g33.t1
MVYHNLNFWRRVHVQAPHLTQQVQDIARHAEPSSRSLYGPFTILQQDVSWLGCEIDVSEALLKHRDVGQISFYEPDHRKFAHFVRQLIRQRHFSALEAKHGKWQGPAAPQERALVPRQPGSAQTTLLQRPAPRAAPKAPASKKFSERDREGCSELLKQLMDAHDYTGNQTGGSEKFRQLVNQAKQLAPVAKRHILEEVPQKYYLASTPGRHRQRLAQIIAEWKAEGL